MTSQPVTPGELERVNSILHFYSIVGAVKEVSKSTIGYINSTFFITTETEKYVLRESNPNTEADHIHLEVEILDFLNERGFSYTPKIIPNTHGAHLTEHEGRFYILQNFITGSVKSSWDNLTHFTSLQRERLFAFLAKFSKTIADFKPIKISKNETVSYYAEHFEELAQKYLSALPDSPGKEIFKANCSDLLRFAEKTYEEFRELEYEKIPQQCVHFDMHPGNVHYDEHDNIVGLFDFDWARFDTRFADLAATISQSCYLFGGEKSGTLIPEFVQEGIKAYRENYGISEYPLDYENRVVKVALQGYYIFQVLWGMDWYRTQEITEKSTHVVHHVTNTCLLNDFDDIFLGK